MNGHTKHWTLKPHRNMKLHKGFLRHRLLKYSSEKSTAKSSAFENHISSANLALTGLSYARKFPIKLCFMFICPVEPDSVSVGRCKFQLKKLYLQTVKKVDHLPYYVGILYYCVGLCFFKKLTLFLNDKLDRDRHLNLKP